jgi:hypothetical protein
MQKRVMQMLYLFEYDDNEEAMIYSIFIVERLRLKNDNLTYY